MRIALLAVALTFAAPAYAQNPVRDTKGGLFLTGLALTGAGLLLGGAGFAVLYVCREGEQCHSDKTLNTVGWVLAAPGIIPLGLGLLLMYLSSGGRGGRLASIDTGGAGPLGFALAPLPGGGAIASGAFRF